jgi:K+-transporting ATPase ATPase C chain
MLHHLRANLWLLGLTLALCSVVYPALLWAVGQSLLPEKAQGSLLQGLNGELIGSRLIAQPFQDKDGNAKDEYFQPRPSAASYKADASGASNWAASNYQLRDRVARALGPIVKYGAQSPKKGQLVGQDIEAWFQKDQFDGKPAIVAQWAEAHSTLAQNWVKADKLNTAHVEAWIKQHPEAVEAWRKESADNIDPKPEDLAVAFFTDFSKVRPGFFPSQVTPPGASEKRMEPVKDGSDIQSYFFDMWRQEHPDADLEEVPADMVMASASGFDPHITLDNALYQLDRVANAWNEKTKGDKARIRAEIEALLQEKAEAPFNGLAGVKLINVLEINLVLHTRYEAKVAANKG